MELNVTQSIVVLCLAFYGLLRITWSLIIFINNKNQQESLEPK